MHSTARAAWRGQRECWPAFHRDAALHAALAVAATPQAAGLLIAVIICDTGERYVSSALFATH